MNAPSVTSDAENMYRRALEIIDEEAGSMSVREEQARGAMVVLGHLIGDRELDEIERKKWLGKLDKNEPIFVLRASDPVAPMAIRLWAAQSWQQHGDPQKIAEARALAEAMEKWHREHRK